MPLDVDDGGEHLVEVGGLPLYIGDEEIKVLYAKQTRRVLEGAD